MSTGNVGMDLYLEKERDLHVPSDYLPSKNFQSYAKLM